MTWGDTGCDGAELLCLCSELMILGVGEAQYCADRWWNREDQQGPRLREWEAGGFSGACALQFKGR
jgi:hypothetical protein